MAFQVLCVAGARPNFMKVAPLFRAFARNEDLHPVLVHTGQHYDESMSGQFFRDLGLPSPSYNLAVGSGSHAEQTAEVMKRFEPTAIAAKPDAVLVVGDVNSTAGCALVAAKLGIPVVHVEAGLRSFDRSMPEEINRLVTDAISDLLLVSEESGLENLRREGVPEDRVYFVGNLMIDSLHHHLQRAKQSDVARRLGIDSGRYGLVTLHRPSNVDDENQLAEIMAGLGDVASSLPLYFPAHPRTRARLASMVPDRRIRLLDPLGYIDFLSLLSNCSAVFTDSGGIQEEATALGICCLTLRENTERPTTIDEGTNYLAGRTRASIVRTWEEAQQHPKTGRIPKYWDGKAAERSIEAIRRHFALERRDLVACA